MWACPTSSVADGTLAGHSWLQCWSPHLGLTFLQDGRPHPAEALLSDGMRRPREQQRQPARQPAADWDGIQQGGTVRSTNGRGTSAGRTGWEDSSPKVGRTHDQSCPSSANLIQAPCQTHDTVMACLCSLIKATSWPLPCMLAPLMCALGSLSQELKHSHWPNLGPSCKGSLPCRASLLKQLELCPQAGAGGGGEDPGYERPRGTAFVNAGGSSPRREARPKRAAAQAAVPAPGTKPQVSNSEWTIARKLFYVQGKQVTTASDALGGWRSSLWPVGGAGHGRVVCYVRQGVCIGVAAWGVRPVASGLGHNGIMVKPVYGCQQNLYDNMPQHRSLYRQWWTCSS